MLVSCVGTISIPKDCTIPGHEKYQGSMFHSARWDHSFDMKDKRVAVIGNGCSGAQLMPYVARTARTTYQFQRLAQWINERPNRDFSAFQKWCFRHVPLANRLYRFYLWKGTDALHGLYTSESKQSALDREVATATALDYMTQTAPEKYHDVLIPKFPLGCKRRIFDPGYLECLHNPNVHLTSEPIVSINEKGIQTEKDTYEVDAIVVSTGFKIQEFLSPIEVRGASGKSLNEHWKDTRGAQAYKATFVTGFPNFGIVFGPNAFPAHNSVIFTNETQAEYIIKTMMKPIINRNFSVIDVKEAAENCDANLVQNRLKSMVWSSGCTNWNLDSSGRNTTKYHDTTWMFWYQLYWPVWKDFNISGKTIRYPLNPLWEMALWTLSAGVLVPGIYAALSYAAA